MPRRLRSTSVSSITCALLLACGGEDPSAQLDSSIRGDAARADANGDAAQTPTDGSSLDASDLDGGALDGTLSDLDRPDSSDEDASDFDSGFIDATPDAGPADSGLTPCTLDVDCDDQNACTQDRCIDNLCVNAPLVESGAAQCGDGVDNDCDGHEDGYDISCTEPICNGDGWCWSSPAPQGAYLLDVAVAGPREVWAVGQAGLVMLWDAKAWRVIESGTEEDLRAVWASGPGDVWIVGAGGTVLHYTAPLGFELVDVGTTVQLLDVHGAGGLIWIGGASGTLIEGNGTSFSTVPSTATADINAVAGIAANDAWAGGGVQLLRKNASGWHFTSTPTPVVDLYAVASNDVWLAGGGVYQWTGAEWVDRDPGAFGTMPRKRIWATTSTTVIVGEGFFRDVEIQISGTWSSANPVDFPSWPFNNSGFLGVSGTENGDIWAVGADGLIAVRRAGTRSFRVMTEAMVSTVRDLWVDDAGHAWVTNGEGLIGHYDGAKWRRLPSPTNGSASSARPASLWGMGPNALFAGLRASSGVYNLYFWNGSSWSISLPGAGNGDMWGADPSRVWLSANGGINVFSGGVWTVEPGVPSTFIRGRSATDVWSAAYNSVYQFDGSMWSDRSHTEMTNNTDIAVTPTHAFVSGDRFDQLRCQSGGYVLQHDGTSWDLLHSYPSGCGLVAIGAKSPTEIWAALEWDFSTGAEGPKILHYDGNGWTNQRVPGAQFVNRIAVGGDGSVWAGGSYVWRRAP